MLENPKIFAIVVTYNAAPWIKKCIESLRDSHYPVQILIVDNHSKDSTLEILSDYSDINSISLNHNIGFGRANNIGMSRALGESADLLFLLNQDAYVEPDTIKSLLKGISDNPRLGILSPLHLNEKGDSIDPNFARYILNHGAENFYSDILFGRLEPQVVYPMAFHNAAAWMITARCVQTVGGFDPLFHMYGEDEDYCRRVLGHGFEIGMLPSSVIFHSRGKSDRVVDLMGKWRTFIVRSSRERSRELVELKTPGNFLRIIALWGLTVFCAIMKSIINRKKEKFFMHVITTIRLILLLPVIYRHRHMSLRSGPIWLLDEYNK